MYACLAVTCHLHFWQNDRDFLRATAVTRGWNGYWNKSQHRKSTLEKKILPPFQQGFEPATFQSRVRCSNHWAIPAPEAVVVIIKYIYKTEKAEEKKERKKKFFKKRKKGGVNDHNFQSLFSSVLTRTRFHLLKKFCLKLNKPCFWWQFQFLPLFQRKLI